MMKPLALDIGNVCLHIKENNCLDALNIGSDTWLPKELLEATYSLETGMMDEKTWLGIFEKTTNHRFHRQILRKAYNTIIAEEIRETREFAEIAVKAGYRLIFFSDTSEIHLDHVFATLSFANLITGGVYSFEVGAKKPSPMMFAEFEKRFGTPLLYLDDKPENIQAGLDAGWPSIQFTAGEKTANDLLTAIAK